MNRIKPLGQVSPAGAYAPNRIVKVQNKLDAGCSILDRLMDFAVSFPDFRRTGKGNIRHRLEDVIMLMVFARASKCVGRAEIIEFGRRNYGKLRKIGMLRNGVPSESTLCRIENGINDLAMADCMQEFARRYHGELLGKLGVRETVCVDGKAERGTVHENGRNPDIVSAYSFNTGITLATEACPEKSNEIKAIPRLIDKIDIAGKVVTADAMSIYVSVFALNERAVGKYSLPVILLTVLSNS